jgi:hypothetical protein
MHGRVERCIVSLAVVIALATNAGCGGGGGSGNDNGGGGDPTPTPTRTFVPIATQTIVGLTPTAHTPAAPTPTPVGATPTDGVTPPNSTPSATPSGTQGSATVVFHVSATATVLGFQFSVPPTAKGRFSGSAALVHCSTPSRELFTKNGKDDGTLILSLAFPTALALPATITCTFDVAAGQQLLATDVTIGDKEVTVLSNDQKGVVGDPSTLVVDVSVS